MTSGKLCPVSTCMTGNGSRAGQNAFLATCSITTLSLPPENSSTGRSNSAATSRRRWIDSDSSASRCEISRFIVRDCASATQASASRAGRTPSCPVRPSGPNGDPRRRRDRPGARPAADRRVALRRERVLEQVVVVLVGRDVVVGPRRERVDLDDAAARRRGARSASWPASAPRPGAGRSSRPACRRGRGRAARPCASRSTRRDRSPTGRRATTSGSMTVRFRS